MLRNLFILLAALVLSACASKGPDIDYNLATDFSRYQSYNWKTDTSGTANDVLPLMGERVKEAIESHLLNRPLTLSETPEVLIRYYVQSVSETRSSNASGSVGLGRSGSNSSVGVSMRFPLGGEKTRTQHQVIIDFYDAETDQLVWRGSDTFPTDGRSPEQLNTLVQQAVNKILTAYPPNQS